MLKANFTITESGGTGIVQLQSSSDSDASWQNIGNPLTLSQGALTVDDNANITIDTSVFIPGQTYQFRLIDISGNPVSDVKDYTIHTILYYTSGESVINFTNTGGDNYSVGFHFTPSTLHAAPGAAVTGYIAAIRFYAGGSGTMVQQSNCIADQLFTMSGLGAGVYIMEATYFQDDPDTGVIMVVCRVVKVDGSGNIIADAQINGISVTSVDGLTIDEEAITIQTGVNYPVTWTSFDGNTGTLLTTGNPVTLSIPPGLIGIFIQLDTSGDTILTDDIGAAQFGAAQLFTLT